MHILENEALYVEIADMGAELTRVLDKESNCERLWNADPAVWSRHAPILFPFVGKVVGGKYRVGGKEFDMKTQHGFARDVEFRCVESSENSVSHLLCASEATKTIYPYDFRLLVRHSLDSADPRLLRVEWEVSNEGAEPMYYAIGAHPGFMPPEGAKKEDCGFAFPGMERLRYICVDPAGFAVPGTVHDLTLCDSAAPFDPSLSDTWIFEDHQVSEVQFLKPDKKPWVTMTCPEFPLLALWCNPKGPFVCIEPWFGRTDDEGFAGDISEKVCEERIEPGMTKKISYLIKFHS